jgi:transposase-like protein
MQIRHIHEFESESDLLNYLESENFCIEYFIELRWPTGVHCTQCNSDNIQTNDNKNFRCRDCRKQFSYLTGTIFQNTKKPLKDWFISIYRFLENKSISSYNLAKKAKVTQSTSWFMLHRIRHAFRCENFKKMFDKSGSPVQIDEAGIHGRNENRHCHNKKEFAQGRSIKNAKAIGMLQDNKVKLLKIDNTNSDTLVSLILEHIKLHTKIITDDWTGYKLAGYIHKIVNHSAKEFCDNTGKIHTNNIESLWQRIKKIIFGTYHYISDKHIQAYLDEMVGRYNLSPLSRFAQFEEVIRLTFTGNLTRRELTQKLAA